MPTPSHPVESYLTTRPLAKLLHKLGTCLGRRRRRRRRYEGRGGRGVTSRVEGGE